MSQNALFSMSVESTANLPQSTLKLCTYHHYCCFIDNVIDSARIKEKKNKNVSQHATKNTKHLGIFTQRINMK